MKVYVVVCCDRGVTALNGAFINKTEAEKLKQYLTNNGRKVAWIEPLTVIDSED